VYLEADVASVTFSGIPGTYEHLQIQMSARNTFPYPGGTGALTFNGTTGTAYSTHGMAASAAENSANPYTGQANTKMPRLTTGDGIAGTTGGVDSADFGTAIIDILDYAEDGNKNTTVMSVGGNSLTTSTPYVWFASGLFDDTTAITSITLDSNGSWMRGSEFTLYGIQDS
jgi:hypothetical protein